MARGKLRGVVCTSSLDLGVDWGDVDLVINIGAPKGASRLMQRIGRANHRIDEALARGLGAGQSLRGVGVVASRSTRLRKMPGHPAAAHRGARRAGPARTGRACGEPFLSDQLYGEVLTAAPYSKLSRTDFDDVGRFRRHRRLCAEDL